MPSQHSIVRVYGIFVGQSDRSAKLTVHLRLISTLELPSISRMFSYLHYFSFRRYLLSAYRINENLDERVRLSGMRGASQLVVVRGILVMLQLFCM